MTFQIKSTAVKNTKSSRPSNSGTNPCDLPVISEQFLYSTNSLTKVLSRVELVKPSPNLPEIQLEDSLCGVIKKSQLGHVRPQKSCESYDSAASGMSWSSSQSTAATGEACYNSNSISSHPSFTGFDIDEESLKCQHTPPALSQMSSPNVNALYKNQSPRQGEVRPHRTRHVLRNESSFDEERNTRSVHSRMDNIGLDSTHGKEDLEDLETPPGQSDEFFHAAFNEREKSSPGQEEQSVDRQGRTKKKSFKQFWKTAYKAIKNDPKKFEGLYKSDHTKKKLANEEVGGEIDPIYQLLKSAATQRHTGRRNSMSADKIPNQQQHCLNEETKDQLQSL